MFVTIGSLPTIESVAVDVSETAEKTENLVATASVAVDDS
jgi:hypothetical protein